MYLKIFISINHQKYPTLIRNYYSVLNAEDGGSVSHATTNVFGESLDAGSTNRDGIVSLSFIIHLDTHQDGNISFNRLLC
jgi:hypothetical protein